LPLLALDSIHSINAIRAYFSIIREWVWAFFTFLFSDMNAFGSPRKGDGVFVISPVQTALNGGEVTEKFFTFMFRRYNLKNDSYVPGTWNVGDTIEEILTHHQELGLTDEQVTERTNVVGQNQIEMRKPTFLMCFYRELAKPFYTYQAFMVWSVSVLAHGRGIWSIVYVLFSAGSFNSFL
jgi:hypothetical protein